jgi:hypothetical protein
MQAWIKTTTAGTHSIPWLLGHIMSSERANELGDWGFGINILGNLAFGAGDSVHGDVTIRSSRTVISGEWVHVAVTRSKTSGQILLYIGPRWWWKYSAWCYTNGSRWRR